MKSAEEREGWFGDGQFASLDARGAWIQANEKI